MTDAGGFDRWRFVYLVFFDDVEQSVDKDDVLELTITGEDGRRFTASAHGLAPNRALIGPTSSPLDVALLQTVSGEQLRFESLQFDPLQPGPDLDANFAGGPVGNAPELLGSQIETRISESSLPDPPQPPFGLPGEGDIPPNQIGHSYLSHYLDPDGPLEVASEGGPERWTKGWMSILETHWEPVGWALDDWIDTLHLAPYESSVQSVAEVDVESRSREESGAEARQIRDDLRSTSSSSDEVMTLAQESATRSRGVNLGLGGTQAGSAQLTLDPVLALTRAVTGAFQVGYSGAKSTSESNVAGSLAKDLETRLEHATKSLQSEQTAALLDLRNEFRDTRTMRSLRNSFPNHTSNLSLFSLVRQWLVTTQIVQRKRVVFIPIHERDAMFDRAAVFEHYGILAGVLLDPTLAPALESVARGYVPDGADNQGEIEHVTGTLRFAEQDFGGGSSFKLRAVWRETGDKTPQMSPWREFFGGSLEGDKDYYVDLGAGAEKISNLVGVQLKFEDTGLRKRRSLLVDGLSLQLHPTGQEFQASHIVVPNGDELTIRFIPPYDAQSQAGWARLKAHLNANVGFYRLAIDLQRDAVSRFEHLTERASSLAEVPGDVTPVGVAGAHIAFLVAAADDEDGSPSDDNNEADEIDKQPSRKLMTTPAGGTFLETIPGARSAGGVPETWPTTEDLPVVAASAEGAYGWHQPFQPATPGVDAPEVADGHGAPFKPSTPGEAELPGKVGEYIDAATKSVESALKEIVSAAAGAVPEQPEAPDAGGDADNSEPAVETAAGSGAGTEQGAVDGDAAGNEKK